MKLFVTPAVVVAGYPLTNNVLAAAGFTRMAVWAPVTVPLTVSVAVMERVPEVLNAALKVCAPASLPVNV